MEKMFLFFVEFWTQADRPLNSPDFNMLDFSVWQVRQAKFQVTSHSNLAALHLSIVAEWDWLAVEHIHKTCQSFCHHLEGVVVKKMAPPMNRLAAQSDTHQSAVSGLP
jgi:hypothetical protein